MRVTRSKLQLATTSKACEISMGCGWWFGSFGSWGSIGIGHQLVAVQKPRDDDLGCDIHTCDETTLTLISAAPDCILLSPPRLDVSALVLDKIVG